MKKKYIQPSILFSEVIMQEELLVNPTSGLPVAPPDLGGDDNDGSQEVGAKPLHFSVWTDEDESEK